MNWTEFIAKVMSGKFAIDAIVTRGDEEVAKHPELAPRWQEERAKLLATRDNPEQQEKVQAAFAQAWGIVTGGEGPIGHSHAHHG